jgi:hypothetical protein
MSKEAHVTVMTRKSSALLDQLTAVAGDPDIVEEALRSLNESSSHAPDLREIIRRILEIKQSRIEVAEPPIK